MTRTCNLANSDSFYMGPYGKYNLITHTYNNGGLTSLFSPYTVDGQKRQNENGQKRHKNAGNWGFLGTWE